MESAGRKKDRGRGNSEAVYLDVRQRIVNRTFYPGQKISESLLARRYGVSRTPIREILKRLEHDGLVRVVPQSGTYVQQRSTREFVEIFQVRTYLECLAYQLALQRASPADLKQLAALAGSFDRRLRARPFDDGAAARTHSAFHHRLVKTARNRTLLEFYERLHLSEAHVFDEPADNEGQRRTCAEHHELVRLLRLKRPAGEKLMRKHLWENTEFLVADDDGRGRPTASRSGPAGPGRAAGGAVSLPHARRKARSGR